MFIIVKKHVLHTTGIKFSNYKEHEGQNDSVFAYCRKWLSENYKVLILGKFNFVGIFKWLFKIVYQSHGMTQ